MGRGCRWIEIPPVEFWAVQMQASSRPEAVGLWKRDVEPAAVDWNPPHINVGVGVDSPLSIWGSLGCQHLDRVCLLHATCMLMQLSPCLSLSDTGKRVMPSCGLSIIHFYTSFSLHLNTDLLQFYSQTLGYQVSCDFQWNMCNTVHSGGTPKKKSADFAESLAASATRPQLQRRWLSPLSPCLNSRDLTRQPRNSKCCVKQGFFQIKYTKQWHVSICNSHWWLFS